MFIKRRANRIKKREIFIHRCIPYVIAEVENPEWKGIEEIEKREKTKFKFMRQMFNKDGGWYILEGLDYFWFKLTWFTDTYTATLFEDSLKMQFNDLTDKDRYKAIKKQAISDIDSMWDNFYAKFKRKEAKKGFTLIELLVIIAIIGLLAVLLIGEVKDFKMKKYLITTGKESFYTDSYLVDSKTNCLEFDEKIVCGNYTIKKLNAEK